MAIFIPFSYAKDVIKAIIELMNDAFPKEKISRSYNNRGFIYVIDAPKDEVVAFCTMTNAIIYD